MSPLINDQYNITWLHYYIVFKNQTQHNTNVLLHIYLPIGEQDVISSSTIHVGRFTFFKSAPDSDDSDDENSNKDNGECRGSNSYTNNKSCM